VGFCVKLEIFCRQTLNWLWQAIGTKKFGKQNSQKISEFFGGIFFEFFFREISYLAAEICKTDPQHWRFGSHF
jgi:hypothetical protein